MSVPPRISDAEWAIMKVLWGRQPRTSTEIAKVTGVHPQTTKTFLARLVKKKAIVHERVGRSFYYRTLVTEKECQRHESRSFLNRVFGGSLRPMVSHLVEEDALTDDEIQELKKILTAKKRRNKK
jgi:BlaI family transcriptional regulator, penicillinase repressor